MHNSNNQIVLAEKLCFNYGAKSVLNNINFVLSEKEFISFIGPSGCGKTTLLNLVAGIRQPTSGSIVVNTTDVAFVFQHDALLAWKSVLENVLMPFTFKGIKVTDSHKLKALEMLSLVGLVECCDLFPSDLSGGMKKRVELARALVTNPKLLILDEPFVSLDLLTRERLNCLVKSICKITNTASILVTHFIEEACFLSDKIYVLSDVPGEIIGEYSLINKSEDLNIFLLSAEENEVAKEIKKIARYSWNQPNPKNYEENGFIEENDWLSKVKINGEKVLLTIMQFIIIFIVLIMYKEISGVTDLIFPHPVAVCKRFFSTLYDSSILYHVNITIMESLFGFIIAFFSALVLGFVLAKSRVLSRLLMPVLIIANTIPAVALAPFLVLWFGFGFTSIVFVSALVIFFPLLINNISAIRQSNKHLIEFINFYKPNTLVKFVKIEVPASIPIILNGIKISFTLSVIGAVVGEFVSGSSGLGTLVQSAKANFDPELMFVALIWLAILGLFYYAVVQVLYLWLKNKHMDLG